MRRNRVVPPVAVGGAVPKPGIGGAAVGVKPMKPRGQMKKANLKAGMYGRKRGGL